LALSAVTALSAFLRGPPPSRVNARNNVPEPTKPHQPEKAGHKKMN
jgi:hypothetical protein